MLVHWLLYWRDEERSPWVPAERCRAGWQGEALRPALPTLCLFFKVEAVDAGAAFERLLRTFENVAGGIACE